MSVKLMLHWLPWTGWLAVWLVEPDGPATTAGFIQAAPGGHTNEWHSRRVQRPREGPLASKGVLHFPWGKYSTAGYPALVGWTHRHWSLGDGTPWSVPWDLRTWESYFHLKDANLASRAASLNLPGETALGVNGTSGNTFPDLFRPLADSPLGPFVDEDDLLEHWWRSPFLPCVQGEGGHSESRGSPCYTL